MQIVLGLYFAFLGAYLSVLLTRFLRQNGRVLERIDEGIRKMDEGFRRMDEGNRRTQEMILELGKLIAKS